MAQQRRVIVSEEMWALLDQLAKTGLFGDGASGAGAHLIREKLQELILSGEIDKLQARTAALHTASPSQQD